jgi:hypothetical protein
VKRRRAIKHKIVEGGEHMMLSTSYQLDKSRNKALISCVYVYVYKAQWSADSIVYIVHGSTYYLAIHRETNTMFSNLDRLLDKTLAYIKILTRGTSMQQALGTIYGEVGIGS